MLAKVGTTEAERHLPNATAESVVQFSKRLDGNHRHEHCLSGDQEVLNNSVTCARSGIHATAEIEIQDWMEDVDNVGANHF